VKRSGVAAAEEAEQRDIAVIHQEKKLLVWNILRREGNLEVTQLQEVTLVSGYG
jgi:hypothetical protein